MAKHERGVIDTSVVIDLDEIDPSRLPDEMAISAITLAELAAGILVVDDLDERALRQRRLQATEASFETIPFDANAARAYAQLFAAVRKINRRPRRRSMDLMIAATGMAINQPLYTRNPDDFKGLETLLDIVAI